MGYHFMSASMAIIKTQKMYLKWCREIGILIHCWCDCEMVKSLWKAVKEFLVVIYNHRTHLSQNYSVLAFYYTYVL